MYDNEHRKARRDFLKKAAYAAPVILTICARPAFASNGSHCVGKGSNFSEENKFSRFENLSKEGSKFAFDDTSNKRFFGKSHSKIGDHHDR